MIHGSLKWAAEAMKGELRGDTSATFTGVCTDTRELSPGEIFFCLVAQRDGHEFAAQAMGKGAIALVIDAAHVEVIAKHNSQNFPVIVVPDTIQALGDLAKAWRNQFAIPIIAIAGSNGKTTTKELTKAVLDTQFRVLATEGNLNNLIGVPKTLFRLNDSHQVAIVEVGMNDFHELARLTQITAPTAGLITNIGMEHLEKLRDLDGVQKAEGELFANLAPNATALINQADSRVMQIPTPARKVYYGNPDAAVWGEVLVCEWDQDRPLRLGVVVNGERTTISLHLPGPHNLSNVLAALAVGHHLQIPLSKAKTALEAFRPAPSRMQLLELKAGRRLLDDCYNANPSSTMAALHTLAQLKGTSRAMAVLGEMLELGDYTGEGHRLVGETAAREKIEQLLAVGPHAGDILRGAQAAGMPADRMQAFATPEEAVSALNGLAPELRWLLVKGSRGIHLEKIVRHLKENF